MGLVFVGWVRPRSSIPTKPEDQNAGGTVNDSTSYIMSSLSSPTLAKMFSFLQFQSTSYCNGKFGVEGSKSILLETTYPNDRRVATVHRGGFNGDVTFGVRV